jgi:hypothetical protein
MMTTNERFEDRLLRELRHVVEERPAVNGEPEPRGRRTRLAWGGVGLGVATATAVVAIVASSGDVTPNAYAVQPHANGEVTVSIHSLSDAAGLQSKLRAAGVPAVVSYTAAGPSGCLAPGADPKWAIAVPIPGGVTGSSAGTTVSGATPPTTTTGSGPETQSAPGAPGVSGSVTTAVASGVRVGDDGVTFTISPGAITPGDKVFISTSTGAVSSIGMAIAATAPTCGPTTKTP